MGIIFFYLCTPLRKEGDAGEGEREEIRQRIEKRIGRRYIKGLTEIQRKELGKKIKNIFLANNKKFPTFAIPNGNERETGTADVGKEIKKELNGWCGLRDEKDL
ncbi:hypothetical protein ACJVDH_20730 [Pedobacter sp. AW1-32]|uniref:hypothetical protein n=1 Tax=Pedobacter sp. AW1-32 TaxID=3383026 RepID=UPI003FEE0F7B